MTIMQIVHLIGVLWNYEPTIGKGKSSDLPSVINDAFWDANDINEANLLADYKETDNQIRWAKDAWD